MFEKSRTMEKSFVPVITVLNCYTIVIETKTS